MPKYNPNSVWGSRKKDDSLTPIRGAAMTPPGRPRNTGQKPAEDPAKQDISQSGNAETARQGVASSAPAGSSLSGGASVAAGGGSKPEPKVEPKAEPKDAFFKKVPIEKFNEPEPAKSWAWLWSIVVFVVLLGGGAVYIFLLKPAAGPNVSIEFTKPSQVLTGDPFQFEVALSNYSSNILKDATLSISLPDNMSFVGQTAGQRVIEQTVGDLGPGSINKQDTQLIVTGDPNSVKHVTVKLVYSTDASAKTQFETDGAADIVVGGPAISLNITAPSSIFSGQNFDMTVAYNNNTSHAFNNVELSLQYPPVYTFSSASAPTDSTGKNSWNLGTIPAAGSGSILVSGNIVGPSNAAYTIVGGLSGQVMGNTYPLTSQSADLALGTSPLEISMKLNNTDDYIAKTGDGLDYTIYFTNNSNITFHALSVKAALVGTMLDFSSVSSNGVFSSLNNTVTWNAANAPQLLNLSPGQSGSVDFQVRTKSAFPIRLLSDKNYTVKVTAQVSSPTVPPGTTASSTVSVTSMESKMAGQTVLTTKAYWRDAASGILNSGPYPPKVNQATQYTIHWSITNYSTDIQNITVQAYLQSGSTCTGQIKSNIATSPVCDPATGEVSWQIPNIPATAGIVAPAPEVIFQVTNTPAINQVGQSVTLMGPSSLSALDSYTNQAINLSTPEVNTNLPDDKTISPTANRTVTQ